MSCLLLYPYPCLHDIWFSAWSKFFQLCFIFNLNCQCSCHFIIYCPFEKLYSFMADQRQGINPRNWPRNVGQTKQPYILDIISNSSFLQFNITLFCWSNNFLALAKKPHYTGVWNNEKERSILFWMDKNAERW